MKQRILRHWTFVAIGLLLIALLSWSTASTALAASAFSGQATVVNATVLGITTTIVDAGPLPNSGGSMSVSAVSANAPGLLSAQALNASTTGQGDQSSSSASVANLNLTVGGNAISATTLSSDATASCINAFHAQVSGNSQVQSLVINGATITVTGAPNQTVNLPNGQVVINEQSSSVGNGAGDITVSALHVIVNGVADIIVSFAHADITCGSH